MSFVTKERGIFGLPIRKRLKVYRQVVETVTNKDGHLITRIGLAEPDPQTLQAHESWQRRQEAIQAYSRGEGEPPLSTDELLEDAQNE